MEMLETAIIIVHVLISLALIGLVLMQQGKGAEAGASFGGGASQTVFGSQGSGNFLSRATSWLAVVFFVTSISLALVAKQKAEVAASGEGIQIPVEMQAGSEQNAELDQSIDDVKQALGGDINAEDAGFVTPEESQGAVPELE